MKRLVALLSLLLAAAWAFASEGHPMTGTWHGNWGPDAKTRTDVTLVLNWDGKVVGGIMNPGLRSAPVEKTTFDPATWGFHFEANYKDRAGAVNRVIIDAKIEDVTHPRRKLVGTWQMGSQKGDFVAQRDN